MFLMPQSNSKISLVPLRLIRTLRLWQIRYTGELHLPKSQSLAADLSHPETKAYARQKQQKISPDSENPDFMTKIPFFENCYIFKNPTPNPLHRGFNRI